MKRIVFVGLSLVLLSGCDFSIPNGVFSCVAPSDCPGGYFCWHSDGLCYDTKEPETICDPASCEEVVAQFAALGVSVECGTLPDGCDGFVECPPCDAGEVCGANGQSLICGCEEATCSTVEAECGAVATGCGTDGVLDCGTCPGGLQCRSNRCMCPEGQDCNAPCGGCALGEVCVEGECCRPLFPCAQNECSPPGGLPDGCGGFVECPPCQEGAECEPSLATQRFECVDDCTCEGQGIECGQSLLCGRSQFCGVCDDPLAPLCDGGQCVCADRYEANDTPASAAVLECDGACNLADLRVEVEGTLDGPDDYDFYRLDLEHLQGWSVRVDVEGLQSEREIFLSYICPTGFAEIGDCSGSTGSFGGSEYCLEDDENTLRLVEECDGTTFAPAAVIVGITSKQGGFAGPCDTYSLTISSQSHLY